MSLRLTADIRPPARGGLCRGRNCAIVSAFSHRADCRFVCRAEPASRRVLPTPLATLRAGSREHRSQGRAEALKGKPACMFRKF